MPADLLRLIDATNRARAAGDATGGAAGRQLEQHFGCAERLAVYGTLAPGQPNSEQLAACPGSWWAGAVTGHRAERDHPVFTYDPLGPPVPVHLLHSVHLPAHWAALDAFEGEAYRRILVPVWDGLQLTWIANLYESVRPVQPAGTG